MAKESQVAVIDEAATAVGYADSPEFEWETAHVEAADQITFDTIGDLLIGIYAGHEIIYPDPDKDPTKFFIQLKWTVPGGAVFTNAGFELRNAYTSTVFNAEGSPVVTDKIPTGSMTRNELKKLVDVDQQSEMKSFRVDVAKPRNNADTSVG